MSTGDSSPSGDQPGASHTPEERPPAAHSQDRHLPKPSIETLESLFGSLRGGVVVADVYGEFLHVSEEAERILGLGAIDAPHESWPGEYGLYREDGVTPIPAGDTPLEHAMAGEHVPATTVLVRNRHRAETVYCNAVATPLCDDDGNVQGGIVAFLDISEQVSAQAALSESTDELDAIIRTAVDAIVTIDRTGAIRTFNPSAERMFGYTADEVIGHNVSIFMPPSVRDKHDGYIQRYLRTGERRVIGMGRELQAQKRDGSVFPVNIAVSEIEGREIFTAFIRDVSEIRKLERQLLEAAAEEQRRIGMELHDKTQQELTGLGMIAQHLYESLAKKNHSDAAIAERLASGISETAHGVRLLARGLVPVQLDSQGLMAALEHLAAETTESAAVVCRFYAPQPVQLLNNFAATHLYRIAQEAVTNAVKHGKANLIEITLEREGDIATLEIRDNGRGIDWSTFSFTGLGLETMDHRARIIDATLRISKGESNGTLVVCEVPVCPTPGSLEDPGERKP